MTGAGLLLAVAFGAGQPAAPVAGDMPQTSVRTVPLGTLDIPDEIAPAILPYLHCLFGSRGIEMRSRDGTQETPAVAMGTDCASRRRAAGQRADRMLRNQGRGNAAERSAHVEAVLAGVDRFVVTVPTSLPSGPAKPDDAEPDDVPAPLSQAVPLGSWVIPPVVAPYRRRYTGCIEGHVTANVVHPASTLALRAGYDQAVAACRDVRRREYAAALRAVENSREYRDSAEGRALVEDAFRTADMVRNRYGEAVRREMLEQQRNPQAATKPETPTSEDGSDAEDQ